MTAQDTRPRVAIACQGGGSHTAFTAGVLGRLFSDDVLMPLPGGRSERHFGWGDLRPDRLVGAHRW